MATTKSTISRRGFLTGAAVAAGGAITTNAFAAPVPDAWDEEFDVIVVGAGAAGAATAVEVANLDPSLRVLLLEKGSSGSGCTPYSGGIMVWSDRTEDFLTYIKNLTKGQTPEDALRAYAEGTAGIRQWLMDLGVPEDGFGMYLTPDMLEGVTAEHPQYEGANSSGLLRVGNGFGSAEAGDEKPQHVYEFLMRIVEASEAIDFRTETPATALIQNPDTKAILGVEAGGLKIQAAKGVVMTCGGFEHDEELMATYLATPYGHSYAGSGNTGDGIRMCQAVGAGFWHMTACAGFWMGGRDLDDTVFTMVNFDLDKMPKQLGITVGVNGRRFYMDCDTVMGNCGQCKVEPYELYSDQSLMVGSRHGYQQFGGEWTHLPMPKKAWFIFDQDAYDTGAISPELTQDPVADGFALTADSIEDLAALIEVPVNELAATVNQWNEFCDRGVDMAFYRPAVTLNKIAKAPFYAQLCVPTMLNTDGGPMRSAKAEVLDPYGNPIPHLYSAGEFGSIWSGTYQGGGNVSECIVFGRIAAKELVEA